MGRSRFPIEERAEGGQGGRDADLDQRPVGIFADGAGRGLVVEGTRIAERVEKGQTPERIDATLDASRHVVLPGLINTHHHFYQTLTRAHP